MIIPDYIKEYIQKCTNKDGHLHSLSLKKYSTSKFEEWLSQYLNYKWIHIFYLIKMNLSDIPLCPVCGSKVFNFYKGIQFCSSKCSNSYQDKIDKTKKQFIDHYGVDNPAKSKEIQDKIKKTNLEKYGTEYPLQNQKIYEKYKSTCLEKYLCDHPLKSKEIQEKQKESCLKKYNTKYYTLSEEFKEKSKRSLLQRYGVNNIAKRKDIKERSIKSYKRTYKRKYYDHFCELLKTKNLELLSSKDEFINESEYKYRCLSCKSEFISKNSNIQIVHCPECYNTFISNKEYEIYKWIASIYSGTIIQHDKSVLNGKELDIYIPDKNIAIEFNGDYWHSSERKDKRYHLNKTQRCQEQGIRLIHIFEHEFNLKRNIIESIIKNSIGIIDNKIYARKTIVKELSQKDYSKFLELNHIQGSINSKYRYGLYYQDELVSVIGFGKSRFKSDEFELYRFCSKLNTSVVGGFSKLISHFMKQNICSEFVTYVDRSKFDASGYFKIGFELLSETEPSYFYINRNTLISRYQTQKNRLSKLLEHYDPSLSESENMVLNGYLKVYDCGTFKLIYKKLVD